MKSPEGDLDPIIKVMKFKHGSFDTTASMRTSDSNSVAEVTPNNCTLSYVCSPFSIWDTCSQCRDDLIANGCTTSQANGVTEEASWMGCCYGSPFNAPSVK